MPSVTYEIHVFHQYPDGTFRIEFPVGQGYPASVMYPVNGQYSHPYGGIFRIKDGASIKRIKQGDLYTCGQVEITF